MEKNDVNINPYISVIITAHNRTEFLEDAIRSVLSQSLERSFYEIIVVKNFENQVIDGIIRESKIISLRAENESLMGEDLALGLERSSGEVLCFLEDDDKFTHEKLHAVYSAFKKFEKLTYFHNGEIFIDERNNNVKFWPLNLDEDILLEEIRDVGQLLRLMKYGLYFNTSSMAVRKNNIMPYIDQLKLMQFGNDDFMFFTSMHTQPRMFMISSEKLTMYRVHQSTSVFLNEKKEDFIGNLIEMLSKSLRSKQVISQIVEDDGLLNSLINYSIINDKLQIYLLNRNISIHLKDTLLYLKVSLKSKEGNRVVTAVYYAALLILSKISRNRIKKLYSYRLFRYNQKNTIIKAQINNVQ
jgi:glycosyltransferase involved in cell wall biosynthesis